MKSARTLVFAGALVVAFQAFAESTAYTVDTDRSVFAIITHKAGVAAKMAHDHLVVAKTYSSTIQNSGETIEGLSFTLTVPVKELAADLPELQKKWYPEIEKAGILDEEFSEISESDRTKIHGSMLSEGQLDAEQFPEIKAELVSIESSQSTAGEKTFEHAAIIRFTVRGKTIERAVPANVALENGVLSVEATGRFRFTEFGIKPFSAFLGAVKNQDAFDVYVHMQANAGEAPQQGE
jgi:hypothetical protein